MSVIFTDGELLRRALIYLDGLIREQPDKPFIAHLERTAMQFNLGPQAAMDLERLFRQECQAPKKP